ncbi:MAG: (Fe-S)-binding protein [Thiobacillaceae bacterium]|jgi:L-lactate dehydrogenase complex protein LldE|nr:(Fe-S)-binding protein [Thiobacillaceae bacterium]
MRVALFVTCLVDLFRPSVGFATVHLLERLGAEVVVPPAQTCCGQPAYNNGDFDTARDIARQVIAAFDGYDHVVVPSGSCAGMLVKHYPELFRDEPETLARAQDLAARTRELSVLLAESGGESAVAAHFGGKVAMHDSCSARRELGVLAEPRALLDRLGAERVELKDAETCCGFGGTFCVKYPDISARMVSDKAAAVVASGAEVLVSGDLGCLMNIAGRLKRMDSTVRVYHLAELLAGMTDVPAIGAGDKP